MSDDCGRTALPFDFFVEQVARFNGTAADDGSEAHEPLACVGERFPAIWEGPVPCEITRLRAENDALRAEVGGLRLRLESLELTYRAALADRAAPARVVSPLHRALAVRPAAFGLHTGLEG